MADVSPKSFGLQDRSQILSIGACHWVLRVCAGIAGMSPSDARKLSVTTCNI
jgi:hypothetical protein